MRSKHLFLLVLFIFISCTEKEALSNTLLQEYLEIHSNKELDEVIACAGSKKGNENTVFIYYYPIVGSSEYRYYETENSGVDPNDFSNYRLKSFPSEGVFGNKLSLYIRDLDHEAWGIVTFLSEGKVHKSNPIRLKQKSNPTKYNENVSIDFSQQESPKFSWNKSLLSNDAIYFQALVNEKDKFISGTYTNELCFRYYDISNVVLDINLGTPAILDTTIKHTITILGVSEDNWVNLQAEKIF